MIELINMAKDLITLLFYIFVGSFLMWCIAHIIMAIIKTLFFDPYIKIYNGWKKILKKNLNNNDWKKFCESEKDFKR